MNHHNSRKTLPSLPRHISFISNVKERCSRVVYTWWAWELSAVVVSIIATAALFTVLATSDQQQQQPWAIGSTQLTLNTVVAGISTILRASLSVMVTGALNQSPWNLFTKRQRNTSKQPGHPLKDLDTFGEAAGGSWGSLKLLHRTKFRYLASLGALLVILSLAFDVFTQQVLAAETRSVLDLSLASDASVASIIPRSTSYVNVSEPSFASSEFFFNHYPWPPLDALAAITSGILGTKRPKLQATCSTGNCTWPVTPTIGVCGACNDVRDKVSFTETGEDNTTYTLLPDVAESKSYNLSVGMDPHRIFALATIPLQPHDIKYQPGRLSIIQMSALGIPASHFSDLAALRKLNQSALDPLLVAHICELYFCLQAFNASSTNGIFEETSSEPWEQMVPAVPEGFDDFNWEPNQPQPTWTFKDVPESMNLVNASDYVVDFESFYILNNAFAFAFGSGQVGLDGFTGMPSFTESGDIATAQAAITEAVWMAANTTVTMDARFQSIAEAFTAYMRTGLIAPFDAHYGPAVATQKVFVVVRWPWLSYPLSLLIAGHAFLAMTLLQTRRRSVRPWKSQRLPLLLAHVDGTIRYGAGGGLHRRDGLEQRVGRMKVEIEFDGQDELWLKRVSV